MGYSYRKTYTSWSADCPDHTRNGQPCTLVPLYIHCRQEGTELGEEGIASELWAWEYRECMETMGGFKLSIEEGLVVW